MSETPSSTNPEIHPRRRRRWLLALPALVAGGLLLAGAAQAHGPRWTHGLDPDEAEAFVLRRLERVLDQLKATPEQRARIRGTVTRLTPEVVALHAEKQKLHTAALAALGADRVDPDQIERLRREAMALGERGSKLISGALVEVSGVLTAEQRHQVMEHLRKHGGGKH